MNGDVHVRFCERLGGRFPGATRLVITGCSRTLLEDEVSPPATPLGSTDAKPAVEPPAYVARHFVESRGAFYYKQRPDVLAFSIRGQSFRARDDSVMTETAIIEMTQHRGWSAVRVRGSRRRRLKEQKRVAGHPAWKGA